MHLARELYTYWKLNYNTDRDKDQVVEPTLTRQFRVVFRSEEIARVFLQQYLDVGSSMQNATSDTLEDRGSIWLQHYRVAEAYSDTLPAMLNNCLQRWAQPHENDRGGSDVFHRSPLHLCAAFGIKGLGEVYLQMGKDPNTLAHPDGQTALHVASDGGHIGMMEKLLGRDADLEKTTFHTGRTALHMAAARGHQNAVKLLLKGGADINATDRLGHTALEVAAQNGHVETVELLFNHTGYNFVGLRRHKAIVRDHPRPTSLFCDSCKEAKEWYLECSDCGNEPNCCQCGDGPDFGHCGGQSKSNEVDRGWTVVDQDEKI